MFADTALGSSHQTLMVALVVSSILNFFQSFLTGSILVEITSAFKPASTSLTLSPII